MARVGQSQRRVSALVGKIKKRILGSIKHVLSQNASILINKFKFVLVTKTENPKG